MHLKHLCRVSVRVSEVTIHILEGDNVISAMVCLLCFFPPIMYLKPLFLSCPTFLATFVSRCAFATPNFSLQWLEASVYSSPDLDSTGHTAPFSILFPREDACPGKPAFRLACLASDIWALPAPVPLGGDVSKAPSTDGPQYLQKHFPRGPCLAVA